ncbi:SWIRM-domain-containing protein, partial [Nadsonia fulvescens var. elongata DSM 6958]
MSDQTPVADATPSVDVSDSRPVASQDDTIPNDAQPSDSASSELVEGAKEELTKETSEQTAQEANEEATEEAAKVAQNDDDAMDVDTKVPTEAFSPVEDLPETKTPLEEGIETDIQAKTETTADSTAETNVVPIAAITTDVSMLPEPEEERAKLEEKARLYLAKQTQRVIIPSFSVWFDRNQVNDIEKKALPEFFNHKNRTKTPEIYMEYRNFMIDVYRLNPSEYLTFTACRRNLAGDVASIMRVHAFLEQWGLINYQIDPETRPSIIGPQFTGHFRVILDTAKGLQPFEPAFKSVKSEEGDKFNVVTEGKLQQQENNDQNDKKHTGSLNLELRRNIYDTTADATALNDENQKKLNTLFSKSYNCYTSGEDISKVRYHNLRTKQSISALCFKQGQFPANLQASDFVKIEQSQTSSLPWNDQELLLLLEGIEMFEDDWESIADHVASRTREDCITKFLQLPIEDPYLTKREPNADEVQNGDLAIMGTESKSITSTEKMLHNLLTLVKSTTSPSTPPASVSTLTLIASSLSSVSSENKVTAPSGSRLTGLVDEEESRQKKIIGSLVEAQLQKTNIKLEKFDELEKLIMVQKQELEKEKLQIYLDRLALKKQSELVLEKLQQAAAMGAGNEQG